MEGAGVIAGMVLIAQLVSMAELVLIAELVSIAELAFSSPARAGVEGAVAALSAQRWAQHRGKFYIPCCSRRDDFPEQAARIWQRWVSRALA